MRIEACGPGSENINKVLFNGEDVTLRCVALDVEAGYVELYEAGPAFGEINTEKPAARHEGTVVVQ